jgi:hypothetical protein
MVLDFIKFLRHRGLVSLFALSFLGCSRGGLSLKPIDINSTEPSLISVLFQVVDEDEEPVPNLTADKFQIYENGEFVFPDRSFQQLKEPPLFLKNILAIDVTGLREEERVYLISKISKALEKLRVDQNSKLMVLAFDENIYLVNEASSNKPQILDSIQRIKSLKGKNARDIYGTIGRAVGLWSEERGKRIESGSLTIITTGADKVGSLSLQRVKDLVGDKKVYIIGVGERVDDESLEQLGKLWFSYDFSEVGEALVEIWREIESRRESFYLLEYLSPKRGISEHLLTIKIAGEEKGEIRAKFDSSLFSPYAPEIKVTVDEERSIDDSLALKVGTSFGKEEGEYIWSIRDPSLATVTMGRSGKLATIQMDGGRVGKTEVEVRDIKNGISTTFPILAGVYRNSIFDFQNGQVPSELKSVGDAPWKLVRDGDNIYMKSGDIKDGENSTLLWRGEFEGNSISFKFRVSSEEGCDEFWFFVDDKGFYQSGEVDWRHIEFPISRGKHTFRWIYKKDKTYSRYRDSAWIDDIKISNK